MNYKLFVENIFKNINLGHPFSNFRIISTLNDLDMLVSKSWTRGKSNLLG